MMPDSIDDSEDILQVSETSEADDIYDLSDEGEDE
jgi:hypothetical protein